MLVMKRSKRYLKLGVKQSNQVVFRTLGEKETYKYFGIWASDTIKQVQMKEKITKVYLRRTGKLLSRKLYNGNIVNGIDTWTVPLVRYSGIFLK